MGVVRMMKNVVDIGGGEDIDALAASLITLGRRSRACAELERLEQARLQAESYDDARVIDESISRVKWGVDHLASLVPQLKIGSKSLATLASRQPSPSMSQLIDA